jgi:hypothetical protein
LEVEKVEDTTNIADKEPSWVVGKVNCSRRLSGQLISHEGMLLLDVPEEKFVAADRKKESLLEDDNPRDLFVVADENAHEVDSVAGNVLEHHNLLVGAAEQSPGF